MVNATDTQSYLEGLKYPADKKTIVHHAREKGASLDVMRTIKALPEIEYNDPTEISNELGKEGADAKDNENNEKM